MIIDAHIHLPAISEERTYEQAKEIMLADFEKDEIDYAILIPDNILDSSIGDVNTCLKLVETEQKLFLMGTIDVQRQGQEWIAYLERLITQHKIVGMKIFPGHDPIYPTDPRLSPLYALCQAYNIPTVIHTGWNVGHPEAAEYNDPKYITQVAQKYPDLRIVIAHYFWPEVEYCYDLTHSYPNIYYDTSGLADEYVIERTGMETVQTVLANTINGDSGKVVFGTDYAMCNRRHHIELVNRLPISEKAREDVFWRNAVKLFNLDAAGI